MPRTNTFAIEGTVNQNSAPQNTYHFRLSSRGNDGSASVDACLVKGRAMRHTIQHRHTSHTALYSPCHRERTRGSAMRRAPKQNRDEDRRRHHANMQRRKRFKMVSRDASCECIAPPPAC